MFQSIEAFFNNACDEAKEIGGSIASCFNTVDPTEDEHIEDRSTESLFPDPHNSMGTYDLPACEEPIVNIDSLSQCDEFGIDIEADKAYVDNLNRILGL